MAKKEYKVISRCRRDLNKITGVKISGNLEGTTLKLNDAQAKRVLATGARLVDINKNVTLKDFAEVSDPQAIPDSKCVDDFTNGDKNRVNSLCKVVGLPRYRKESVVEAETAIVPDVVVGTDYETLAAAIEAVEDGAVIGLPAGTFTETLELSKSVTIVGASAEETKIDGNITISGDAEVSISNVTLSSTSAEGTGSSKSKSKGSSIIVSDTATFELTDSVVEDETYFYSIIQLNTTGVVKITGVTFKENQSYHVIEWNTSTPVADGSEVSNCVFEENCSTHNAVSIYDVQDGAHISFNNNIFKTTDAYRISNVSGNAATIDIINNRYDNVLKDDASKYYEKGYQDGKWWSGLLFQAYKDGMDFSKMVVNIIDNIAEGYTMKTPAEATCAEEQAYYVYKDNPDWTVGYPIVNLS
jgi:hypothetical protein